jgi:hypothetical protein
MVISTPEYKGGITEHLPCYPLKGKQRLADVGEAVGSPDCTASVVRLNCDEALDLSLTGTCKMIVMFFFVPPPD